MVSRRNVVERASRYITYTIDVHHRGECSYCGAWRPDGRPPTVHRHKCSSGGPDGSQLSPTAVLPPSLQWEPSSPPRDEPRPPRLHIPDRPSFRDTYSRGKKRRPKDHRA